MNGLDYEERFGKKEHRFSVWRIIKWLFLLLIALLFCFVGLRSCTMRGRGEMKDYLWTAEAMEAAKSEDFIVYEVSEHNRTTISSTFAVSKIYYTESVGQLQFLLSYNKSLLNLIDKYELTGAPANAPERFVFTLVDQNGVEYRDYVYVTDSLFRNNFFRLVFSGLPFAQDTAYTLRAYWLDAPEEKSACFDTLPIYQSIYYREAVRVKVPSSPASVLRPAETIAPAPKETAPGADGQ